MPKNSDIFPEKSVLGITLHKNNSIFPGFTRNLYNELLPSHGSLMISREIEVK